MARVVYIQMVLKSQKKFVKPKQLVKPKQRSGTQTKKWNTNPKNENKTKVCFGSIPKYTISASIAKRSFNIFKVKQRELVQNVVI